MVESGQRRLESSGGKISLALRRQLDSLERLARLSKISRRAVSIRLSVRL